MDPLLVSLVACTFMLGGALTGMYLRRALPERHLDGETKEIVRLGAALLATVAALVLSLLINSANQSFGDKRGHVERVASDVALLDRLLAAYGPEAREVRVLVRRGSISWRSAPGTSTAGRPASNPARSASRPSPR